MSNCTELDYADKLVKSAIYAPEHYATVITLACALTHKIDDVDSAPRVIALGLPGSGKSTMLRVAYRLAANCMEPTAVLAMSAPSYIAEFRMNPRCTPNLDEINQLFGEAGQNGKHSKFYSYLNQGHLRETGVAKFQENKVPLKVPIFGVAFMAGRGLGCPEDTRDRAVILAMAKAPENVQVADFSLKETKDTFTYGGNMLKSWAQRSGKLNVSACRGLHPKLNHRTMDVWGPLIAVAMEADGGEPGEWTEKALTAFDRIELNSGVPVYAPEDQLLVDYVAFCDTRNASEGVPSGDFAQYATEQPHGAYAAYRPGQFKQFAVKILGPTTPYYDSTQAKMVRGWSDVVHKMNLDHARSRKEELEASKADAPGDEFTWEDF